MVEKTSNTHKRVRAAKNRFTATTVHFYNATCSSGCVGGDEAALSITPKLLAGSATVTLYAVRAACKEFSRLIRECIAT